MEPPTKKRRHGTSSQKDPQDEDDDDELASHPQEIKIRRDPEIQLALKRANANQKLHATMAHIIEKYSRDFEGIGDEIDMATGEIVVNNGHLRNMRDEGDVEGLWVEGDSNIDEDEGILLEDLTDEFSGNEAQVNEIRDSQTDNESDQASKTKEHDPDSHLQDQNESIAEALNNVSNIVSSQNQSPQDKKSTGQPSEIPHDDPRLGHPSFESGPSLGYGMPPPGFGPWGMMPGFPMQAWGRDDIPPYFNMPPSMPGPWYTGGKYEFPSNNGQASIWGRNWTRKTKRAGSMKGSFKRASDEQLSGAPVGVGAEIPDGDRGSEPESTGGNPNKQEAPLSDRTINASDEDDDFLCSGNTDPTPMLQSSPAPSCDQVLSKNRMAHDPPDKTPEEINGNAVKESRQSDEKEDSGRRRSGRARKQTEYMGKISWDDARELKKSGKTFTVRIQRAHPSLREEFETVNVVDEDTEGKGSSSSEQTEKGSSSTNAPGTEAASQNLVVPDSQDTATPFNSSARGTSQSNENTREPSPFIQSMMPTMELSDDEAPIVLSRIRVSRRQNKAPTTVYSAPDVPTGHQKRSPEPADVTSTPPNNNNDIFLEAEIGVVVVDDAVQSPRRKRGRPRGSTNTTKATPPKTSIQIPAEEVKPTSPAPVIVSTTGDLPQSTKRKRGRPRKSDGMTSITQDDAKDHTKELGRLDDKVPENNQQTPVGEIPDNEEPKASPPLSRELRWLLKTKPRNSTPDRTQGTFSNKPNRPRRSKETLHQAKYDAPEPQEATRETREVLKDIGGDPKERTLLQKPQALAQEADVIMEDVPEALEDYESVQDDPPLPGSPSSPPPDNETLDDGELLTGDEPAENDSPTLHVVADDEAIEDEDSLPPLPQDAPIQEASTPRKPKDRRSSFMEPPSSSQKPRTPRHTSIRTTRAPSSRRSLLSFVSDSDSDTEGSRDELTRRVKSHSISTSARPSSKKVWRPTTLTREVHRTPSRRRVHDMSSPVGAVKTPGGTIRTCGVDGYHCGRDYCFTCI